MNDSPLGQNLPTARQLSPWQVRQAAMLYHYASLEYPEKFHLLVARVVEVQGDTKLAIRGNGTHTADPALQQPWNAGFLKHLESVWNGVQIEKR
jgi:hypothetical protein